MRTSDEFNEVKVSNEGGNSPIEFGKIQDTEFTFYNDNKNNSTRDELNANTNKNNENVKKGSTQTNNNDLIDKAINTSEAAAEAAATGGGAAAAASAAAGGTASAAGVVGAAVVAVATIGGGIGIKAISTNNASVQFQNIYIGETFMSYALELKDSNNDKFKIYVESPSYLAFNILEEGANEGSFEQLSPNSTYRIYVQEDNENQKIIYDSSFTTMADGGVKPEFWGVNFSESANFLDYTFTVSLSFFDEGEHFSDFVLYVYDIDNVQMSKQFELETTNSEQTLSGLGDSGEVILDVRSSSFGYSLGYYEDGEERMYESEDIIQFTDSTNSHSEMKGFNISETANFLTYEFGVTLDYVDDFNIITEPILTMTSTGVSSGYRAGGNIVSVEIPLELIKTEQTIKYSDYNQVNPEIFREQGFTFTLSYKMEGVKETIGPSEGQETIKFADSTSSESTINQVTVSDSANFLTYEFTVTIDFVDDFNELGNFALLMTTRENQSTSGVTEVTIPLSKITTEQTVNFSDYCQTPKLLRSETFTIVFTYTRRGMSESISLPSKAFTDSTNSKSEVNGATISETANYSTYEFEVALDYVDDFEELDNFSLQMTNQTDGVTSTPVVVNIPLTKQLTAQTVKYSDYNSENPNLIRTATFDFVLSWTKDGVSESKTLDSVRFTDNSGIVPEVSGASVSDEANYIDYTFVIQVGYVDELDQIENFYLDLTEVALDEQDEPKSQRVSLLKDLNRQTVDLDESGVPVDIRKHTISMSLVWTIDGQEHSMDLGTKRFIDNSGTVPTVSGLAFGTADYVDLTFDITLQYEDVLDQLETLSLTMTNESSSTSYDITLVKTTDTQTINFKDYELEEPEILRTGTFFFVLNYQVEGESNPMVLEIGSHHFEDVEGRPSESDMYSVSVLSEANFTDYTFTVVLNYEDPYGTFDEERCSIYIGGHDFPLALTTAPQTISAKEDGEVILDISSGEAYDWLFTYYTVTGDLGQIQSTEPVTFADENYEPVFNGATIDEFADFVQQEFYVTLDYIDVLSEFSGFVLEMTYDDGSGTGQSDPINISLENTTKKQRLLASEYGINLASGSYNWRVLYNNEQKEELDIVGASGTVTFQNKYDSSFNALITNNYNVTLGPSEYTVDYILPFRLDYDNRGGYYRGMFISINGTEFEVNETTSWQYIDITTIREIIGEEVAIQVNAYYYDYATETREKVNLYSETVTLVLNENAAVYGATLGETSIPYLEPAIDMSLLVYDYSKDTFDNYQLIVKTDDGTEYAFDINTSEISNLMNADVHIDISNETELVEYLQNEGVVTLYLSYRTVSTQTTTRIMVQENVSFYFYA